MLAWNFLDFTFHWLAWCKDSASSNIDSKWSYSLGLDALTGLWILYRWTVGQVSRGCNHYNLTGLRAVEYFFFFHVLSTDIHYRLRNSRVHVHHSVKEYSYKTTWVIHLKQQTGIGRISMVMWSQLHVTFLWQLITSSIHVLGLWKSQMARFTYSLSKRWSQSPGPHCSYGVTCVHYSQTEAKNNKKNYSV